MISNIDVRSVFGTDVYGPDGHKIGSAGQVYLDNETGEPAWVAVRTGLFGRKESFVPLRDATLTGDRLEVPFGKDQVKHAPSIDQDGELGPADEDELYRYYWPDHTADAGQHTGTSVDDHRDGAADRTERDRTEQDRTGHDRTEQDRTEHDRAGQHRAGQDDDAMTRSEERLVAGTRTEVSGKARLRKYIVTEERQVTVPVSREEVRLEEEPAGAGRVAHTRSRQADDARSGQADELRSGRGDDVRFGQGDPDEEHVVTLYAEQPVVTTETVPVERVRIGKQTVTDQETVTGEVRKERIDLEDDTRSRRDS